MLSTWRAETISLLHRGGFRGLVIVPEFAQKGNLSINDERHMPETAQLYRQLTFERKAAERWGHTKVPDGVLARPASWGAYLVKGMLDTMLNKRGIYTFFFGHAADAELERVIRTCYMRGDLLLCSNDKLPSVNMAVTAEQFERLTYKHRAGLYHNASAHESMIYLLLEPGADEHLYLLRSTATMGTVLPIYTGFLS